MYVALCILLLLSNMPQSSIEPVDPSGHSFIIGGRKELGLVSDQDKGVELSRMVNLLHSTMFSEQGIKLKWIKERIVRWVCQSQPQTIKVVGVAFS